MPRLNKTLASAGLFAALALTAGCDMNHPSGARTSMAPPTRGGAGEALPLTPSGQSAVTNPSMTPAQGMNRPYATGSDPNMPANTGNNSGVSGKPSGSGP